MLQLAPLILRNVLRNKRRTALSLASTAISLAILTVMVSLFQGFFYGDDVSAAGALRLVTRHRVALVQPLPSSYIQRIQQVPGVEFVASYSWFQGKFRENKPTEQFARMAVDPEHIFDIYSDYTISREELDAFKKGRTACAVAERIATLLNLKVGDRMTIVGDIYPVTLELTVAAIFKHPKNAEQVFFHREYLSELLPPGHESRDVVGTYIMRADSPESIPRISRAIDSMFDNSSYPTRTESEKEFGRSFLAFLGNLKLYLGVICAAVTFTIMLVSANAISMSVRERTRETGIMRTLGYAPAEILGMIIGESVVISFIGGVIGMLMGATLLAAAYSSGAFPYLVVTWQGASVVFGVAIFVGIVAAAIPGMITSRRNIVESIRFTG